MATLEQRIILLAQATGTDVKTLRTSIGVLANLTTTAKTDIVTALNEVYTNSTSANTKIGTLANLTTTVKTDLVSALNEVNAAVGAIDLTALINDASATTSTTTTYSANKINSAISAATAALVASAPATLDTLNELALALGNDPSFATSIATSLGNRVRVDAAQTFTAPQMLQARDNISAASQAAVAAAQSTADTATTNLATLTTNVGDTNHDFVADYNTAKA